MSRYLGPWDLLALLVGIGVASYALNGRPSVVASNGEGAVTTLTPAVAGGDQLGLRVTVTGGARIAIRKVHVRGVGVDVTREGPGATWGALIKTKADDLGVATMDVFVTLPEELAGDAQLEVVAATVKAVASGEQSFSHQDGTVLNTVPIRVRSRGERETVLSATAVLVAAWAILGSMLAGGALARYRRRDRAAPYRESDNLVAHTAMLALFAVATFFVVARPLGDLAGWHGDLPQLGIAAATLALVAGSGRLLTGAARPPPISGTITPTAADASPSYRSRLRQIDQAEWRSIGAALEERGLVVLRSDRALVVSLGGMRRLKDSMVTLDVPTDDARASIAVRFNDSELLFRVAWALTPALGPVRLDLEREGAVFRYVVDERADIDSLVREFRKGQRDRLALQRVRADLLELLARRAGGE